MKEMSSADLAEARRLKFDRDAAQQAYLLTQASGWDEHSRVEALRAYLSAGEAYTRFMDDWPGQRFAP
jgi:hypothetical protein